jgi:hypothetical protein
MVKAQLRPEVISENRPPRAKTDYMIEFEGTPPDGVAIEIWV